MLTFRELFPFCMVCVDRDKLSSRAIDEREDGKKSLQLDVFWGSISGGLSVGYLIIVGALRGSLLGFRPNLGGPSTLFIHVTPRDSGSGVPDLSEGCDKLVIPA